MAQMTGADAQALEQAAAELRTAADELESYSTGLTSVLGSVQWLGPIAGWFLDKWSGTHRVRLTSTAEFVRGMAVTLDSNAADQRTTSDGDGGGGGGGGSDSGDGDGGDDSGDDSGDEPTEGPNEDSAAIQELKDALKALGLTLKAAELQELAELLDTLPPDQLDNIMELFENDAFVKSLKSAGKVIGLGDAVLNFAQDYAEHPNLSMEERIVHAAAETAILFAASEGAEAAGKWLGTLAAGAISGGLAAPVGYAIGMVAGEAISYALGELDGHFDLSEKGADVATDVIMSTIDQVGAAIEAGAEAVDFVVDVGGEAIEFTGDLAGDTIEFTAEVGGEVVDFAVDVGGATVDAVVDGGGAVLDAGGAALDATGDALGSLLGR